MSLDQSDNINDNNGNNPHDGDNEDTTTASQCLLSWFVGLIFLPVGLLYAVLATFIAGYWELKTWLENIHLSWDSLCENMCGRLICLPLLLLTWTFVGLEFICVCLLSMIRILRAEYRDLMQWLFGTTPSSSSPQARSNASKPRNLLKEDVLEFLIVREVFSLDSIPEPRKEAAGAFPKHSRDFPGPITVLGDSTLLCFSEPIGIPSGSGGGGSDENDKNTPGVTDAPSNSTDHMESESRQGDEDIETGIQHSSSDTSIVTYIAMEATQGSEVKSPNTACSICLEDFRTGDFVAWSRKNLDCPHVYHHHCLMNWLEQRKRCPVCRREYS